MANKGGSANTAVKITNLSGVAENVTVIVAAYEDGTDKMASYKAQTKQVDGDSVPVTFDELGSLTGLGAGGNLNYKVFVWDGCSNTFMRYRAGNSPF